MYKKRQIRDTDHIDFALCGRGYKLYQKPFHIEDFTIQEPVLCNVNGRSNRRKLNNCGPTAYAVMGLGDRLMLQKKSFGVEKSGTYTFIADRDLIGEHVVENEYLINKNDVKTKEFIKYLNLHLKNGFKTLVSFSNERSSHITIFINFINNLMIYEGQKAKLYNHENDLIRYIVRYDKAVVRCVPESIEAPTDEIEITRLPNSCNLVPFVQLPDFDYMQDIPSSNPGITIEENKLIRYLNYIIISYNNKFEEQFTNMRKACWIDSSPENFDNDTDIISDELEDFPHLTFKKGDDSFFVYNKQLNTQYNALLHGIRTINSNRTITAFIDNLLGYQCKYKDGNFVETNSRSVIEYYIPIIKDGIDTLVLFTFVCNNDMIDRDKLNDLLDYSKQAISQKGITNLEINYRIIGMSGKKQTKRKIRKYRKSRSIKV
jgi:hypothetical protein